MFNDINNGETNNRLKNKNRIFLVAMNKIYITKNDHKKLIDLVIHTRSLDKSYKELSAELKRAIIVEPKKIPSNVVTMNSLVSFIDIDSKEKLDFWLVFPRDADINQKKISVFSPIGCGLLGCQTDDIITIDAPSNR